MVWFSILQLWHIHGVLLVRQQDSAYLGFDQITVFSILLLLFAMAGVLIFFMLRQKSQANRVLEKQQGLIQAKNEAIAAQNEALRKANNEVKQLLKIKSDFMSQMSHEIRTPMHSILGLTDLLLQEANDSETMDKLQSIRYSADILLVIINDILDLAAIEDGHVSVMDASIRLQKIAQEIQRNLYPKALQKDIALEIDLDKQLPHYVRGDMTRLYQVLINLSNNALKFTKTGKVVLKISCIASLEKESLIRFEITDTGIGIREELLPHIFKGFEQGGSAIQKEYGGTGLGLTIAQKLVGLMGGELQVSSTFGEGSRFWFDLRMAAGERPTTADATHQPDDVLDLSAMKILYAEDNLMNQKVMSLLLKTYGIVPVMANNGKEALHMLEKTQFDVVLMDFRMPEMDGFIATERIRAFAANHINHNIPIIGVSADVFDESTAKGLALGMNATLAKPIDKNQLESALNKYLSRSERAMTSKETK